MSYDWVPGAAVGVISSIVAWVLSWRIASARSEEREKRLSQDIHDLKEDWKSGIEDVRKLADATARLQSSQNVVNAVTAKGLEAITEKIDRHDTLISDHSATIRLLVDRVMQK